jgi:DNA-binding transcriptional ArsR family regulator
MDTVEIFKALADPARLKIVCMVAEAGDLCVCRIVEALDMGQPAVSHHLAKLRYSGVLAARKEGQWVHYSLNTSILEQDALAFLADLIKAARQAYTEEPSTAPCCPGGTEKQK